MVLLVKKARERAVSINQNVWIFFPSRLKLWPFIIIIKSESFSRKTIKRGKKSKTTHFITNNLYIITIPLYKWQCGTEKKYFPYEALMSGDRSVKKKRQQQQKRKKKKRKWNHAENFPCSVPRFVCERPSRTKARKLIYFHFRLFTIVHTKQDASPCFKPF